MKEKQIVFFDLDGTLLTSELKVADSPLRHFMLLKNRG
jgi:hydroxymethylpyrimidine pyrophosphatase-like HAD family hydrolase